MKVISSQPVNAGNLRLQEKIRKGLANPTIINKVIGLNEFASFIGKYFFAIVIFLFMLTLILASTNIGSHSIRNLQMRNYIDYIRSQPNRQKDDDDDDDNDKEYDIGDEKLAGGIGKWVYF